MVGRDTGPARRTFLESRTPAELKEHFAAMGAKSGEARRGGIFLSREEREALGECYALLRKIATRVQLEMPSTEDESEAAA